MIFYMMRKVVNEMFYKVNNYCFSDSEMSDIELCLKEYQIMIKMLLGDKKYPLNKTIRKLYKERLDYFDFLFMNLDKIKDFCSFKTDI